jgi:hypothetical protein
MRRVQRRCDYEIALLRDCCLQEAKTFVPGGIAKASGLDDGLGMR